MGASAPWRPQAATANPPHAGHKQAASFPPPLASSSPLIEAAASRGVSFFIAAASLPGNSASPLHGVNSFRHRIPSCHKPSVLEISWMTTTPTPDEDGLDGDHSYDGWNN
ncbi:hypothetical protein U9M48_040237 [Paspalum notatum var. saurae]|uniref:Uncharacterized protein n=1 Tax=Paspalum notatum var. saurae TaxID=547442 RepID=A0AAQ3XCY6_PASNO